MAALSVEEKREKRARQLQRNIESLIFMTDDPDDVVLLGTLFLCTAKNIFLSRYSREQTRNTLHKYVDDTCS